MDYCSSCRRHLNGALACPGCGAYAPDIAPRAVVTPWQAPADSAWYDGTDYTDGTDEAAEDPYDDSPAMAAGPLGRAARRRQRVRWKKTQRRALVATAVALVGGGLTVASLDRQSTDRAQAASAPDTTTMGVADEEATEPTPSASTPTGRHRAPDPTPSARSTATANAPHEQTAGTPQATPTSRRLTITSVPSKTSSATQHQAAAAAAGTTSGTTATPSEPTATPTPSAGDSTSTPPASPAPTATSPSTSPSQLCLLVICIG
ncbi:hypothetical protein AB0D59_14670 [Streptomyces sp. NPDC048417]|uniref:SCO2400 family protein n=1 Tax=Streptomyces sp. NPDC048417 TaxID=3155387 RepID=UPI00343337CB